MHAGHPRENAFDTKDRRLKRLPLMLLGGLLIGLATSLPLAVGWVAASDPPVGVCLFGTEANPEERVWFRGRIFPLPCLPTFLFIQPAVAGGFLGAGIAFGLIAHRLAGRGSGALAAGLGGATLFLLSYLGMWAVPGIPAPEMPLLLSSGVAEPFAFLTFGIAFVIALALCLALRTPGFLWRALVAAAATGSSHWLVTWLLLGHAVMLWTHDPTSPPLADSLPALSNGMGPMMGTILLANLVAGTIGGWVTLRLLATPTATDHYVVAAHPASGVRGGRDIPPCQFVT
jgi:hypothetical protein